MILLKIITIQMRYLIVKNSNLNFLIQIQTELENFG